MVTREEIVAEARTWLGTPYAHQASLKGVGCDCLGLIRGVYHFVTGRPTEAIAPYTPMWTVVSTDETMVAGARDHLDEILTETPSMAEKIAALQIGDVVLFRMLETQAVRHCGIVSVMNGEKSLIHAWQMRSAEQSVTVEVYFGLSWRTRLAHCFKFREVV